MDVLGYLRDESSISGYADSVYLPNNSSDIAMMMRNLSRKGEAITVQGARTGVCAGAVPRGGTIISTNRCNKVLDLKYQEQSQEIYLTVEPGVIIEDLRKYLSANNFELNEFDEESKRTVEVLKDQNFKFWFPPNPTEEQASIGGIISTNASGSHVYGYSEARNFVQALEIILPNGEMVICDREAPVDFEKFILITDRGRKLEIPKLISDTPLLGRAGYALYPEASGVDLFCGAESTLGILSKIKLRLIKAPQNIWGILIYFEKKESILPLLDNQMINRKIGKTRITAIDYIDQSAFSILKESKEYISNINMLPNMDEKYEGAMLLELVGDSENELLDYLDRFIMLLDENTVKNSLAATTIKEYSKFRMLQHAVVEAVNLLSSKDAETPVILDMIINKSSYFRLLDNLLNKSKEYGLKVVIWGHIGIGHLHLHILPNGELQRNNSKILLDDLIARISEIGGSIGNPYGIGRLKSKSFRSLHPRQAAFMREVKKNLDPEFVLQRGVYFNE